MTSADLDVCHGRMLDGKYRYHLTSDFPYVLGCYWGAGAKDNSPRVSYTCDPEVGTGKRKQQSYGTSRDKYFIDLHRPQCTKTLCMREQVGVAKTERKFKN